MSYTDVLEVVADLRDTLDAAGIRTEQDAGALTPPGVLIQVTALDTLTLTSLEVSMRLLLVVPSSDHTRALVELVALLEEVAALLDPAGPITSGSVVLPGDAAPVPALVFPLTLTTP